jgi:hypothetical protein
MDAGGPCTIAKLTQRLTENPATQLLRDPNTSVAIMLLMRWIGLGSCAFLMFCPVSANGQPLRIEQDGTAHTIRIYRTSSKELLLTQNTLPDKRPYIHPVVAPDGKGVLTEYRPAHHLHQTGIYWGLKMVNGRDFFMQWEAQAYRRVSATVVSAAGQQVEWQTVYDMLDESGNAVMTETQNWSMKERNGTYVLDLEWKGQPKIDITLGKFYVGGLFLRMPWKAGIKAEIVNAVGQRNQDAEQQRAIWIDLGIQIDGRDDLAHIAVFDHPDNFGFPIPWRVDTQMGFGPNNNFMERRLEKGRPEVIRYRLIAYMGGLDPAAITRAWKEFIKEN